MKCPICGAELESDSKFCTSCGKQLDNIEQQTASPQTVTISTNATTTPKSNNHVLLIVLAILGGLFVFGTIAATVLGFIFYKIGTENSNNYVEKYEGFENKEDGEVLKVIKTPIGHEVEIKYDDIYLVKAETSYLYDKADELKEKAKIADKADINKLNATPEEKQATLKVIEYLDKYVTYSRGEIKEELEKKYDEKTVKYALENAGVDWEERAVIEAIEFLAAGGFSKNDIIEMLKYNGYSEEMATKVANSKEFDYYEQAIYDACFYKYTEKTFSGSYSREEAKEMLEYSGYTSEEIEFALKSIYDELDY